jgi:hypothetical protein
MFSAWGAFVYRFRRPIALVSIAIAIASSCSHPGHRALSAGGWTDPDSESAVVTDRLAMSSARAAARSSPCTAAGRRRRAVDGIPDDDRELAR